MLQEKLYLINIQSDKNLNWIFRPFKVINRNYFVMNRKKKKKKKKKNENRHSSFITFKKW